MIPELKHLKAVIEGQPDLPCWREWFTEHSAMLERILSRGQLLRLRYYPTKEIPKILGEHAVPFMQSGFYEWLDSDSTSGRCRECGAVFRDADCGHFGIIESKLRSPEVPPGARAG